MPSQSRSLSETAVNRAALLLPDDENPGMNEWGSGMAKFSATQTGVSQVVELPGHEAHRAELNCDRMLVKNDKGWEIVPTDNKG